MFYTIISAIAIIVAVVAIIIAKEAQAASDKMLDEFVQKIHKDKDDILKVSNDLDKTMVYIHSIEQRVDDISEQIQNESQLSANSAVSDAMDQIDISLENNERAINAVWQSLGTLKKRMDKIDPPAKKEIDPAENLKHQQQLMDTMLKQSTDAYAEKLKKAEQETITMQADHEEYDIPVVDGIKMVNPISNTAPEPRPISQKYFDQLNAWKEQEAKATDDDKTDILEFPDEFADTADFDLGDFFNREATK